MGIVFTNCYLSLAGTDFSTSTRSVTLNWAAEMLDDTAMGDTTRSRAKGLYDWSLDIELYQDFTDSGNDEDLYTAFAAGTCAVILKPNGSTTSATNPKYTGTGIIEAYPAISGTVGDLGIVRLRVLSQGAMTRAEAD